MTLISRFLERLHLRTGDLQKTQLEHVDLSVQIELDGVSGTIRSSVNSAGFTSVPSTNIVDPPRSMSAINLTILSIPTRFTDSSALPEAIKSIP
jgi:hypothetical protein